MRSVCRHTGSRPDHFSLFPENPSWRKCIPPRTFRWGRATRYRLPVRSNPHRLLNIPAAPTQSVADTRTEISFSAGNAAPPRMVTWAKVRMRSDLSASSREVREPENVGPSMCRSLIRARDWFLGPISTALSHRVAVAVTRDLTRCSGTIRTSERTAGGELNVA